MGQLHTQRRIEVVFFWHSLCEVDKTDVLHINRWRIKEIKKIGQPLLKKGPIDKSFPKKMQKRKIYCSHLLAHCQLDSFNLLRSVLVVIFFIFNFLIFNFFIFLPCGNGTCSLLKAILTAPLLFGFPPAFEYIGIIMTVQMVEGCTISGKLCFFVFLFFFVVVVFCFCAYIYWNYHDGANGGRLHNNSSQI